MLLQNEQISNEIKELREAMKGLGTDDTKLMEILGTKTPKQMSQLMLRYHSFYGRTLYQHISGEVSGSFGSLCKGLSVPIIEYDVDLIDKALDKIFSANYSVLTEILVGRTNHDIKDIKKLYKEKYQTDLEVKIRDKCYGSMKDLYIACLEANREENKTYTNEEIDNDVEELFKATEASWGTNELVVIKMFCNRQFQHLRNVFYAYQKKYSSSITDVIENEFFGTLRTNLLILVKSAMNRQQYVTEEFRKEIMDPKIKHKKLIRYVIRYRTPLIIDEIKKTYKSLYKTTMGDDIKKAAFVSDNTRELILMCINETKFVKPKEATRSISNENENESENENENGIEREIKDESENEKEKEKENNNIVQITVEE